MCIEDIIADLTIEFGGLDITEIKNAVYECQKKHSDKEAIKKCARETLKLSSFLNEKLQSDPTDPDPSNTNSSKNRP